MGVVEGTKPKLNAVMAVGPLCLLVCVSVGDVCGFVSEGGEEGVVLSGEMGAECGGNGVGEGEWRNVVEHGARVAL
jgi:hypothetical protein